MGTEKNKNSVRFLMLTNAKVKHESDTNGKGEDMTNEELVRLIQDNQNVKENLTYLWIQNQGFIRTLASKYKDYENIDDLIQQAYFGLYIAAYNYDPEHNVKFLSYAGAMIKAAIHEYIEDCGQAVRIPRSTVNMKRKYAKVSENMLREYGRKPTDEELCGIMHITQPQLKLIRHSFIFDNMKSLDIPVGNDEDNDTLLSECISSKQDIEQEVTDRLQAEELKMVLNKMLMELAEEQREVLRLYYLHNMTMPEIDRLLNLKAGSARTIKDNARRELKKPHRIKRLKPFIEEYITTHAMRSTGVGVFNRTWTSATEKTALEVAYWQQSRR